MPNADSRELARRFGEAWDRRDTNELAAILADNFVDHDALPGQDAGRNGYIQMASAFFSAYPDIRVRNEDIIAESDKAVLRWTGRGTHKGDLMGMPPTGKQVNLKGIDIIRVANGKIVERWGEFDAMGMMQQLGALAAH